ALWHTLHVCRRLYPVAQRPRARRFPVSHLAAENPGEDGSRALYPVLFSRHPRLLHCRAFQTGRRWMAWGRSNSPATVPLAPFKTIIPIVGVLMLLQGIVEFIRCIQCIRTGKWPRRLRDIEELENQILAERAAAAKGGNGK